MALWNTPERYGAATKALHWITVGLFAAQFAGGLLMTRLSPGAAQDLLYNWHKTLGLLALLIALARLAARHIGALPDWAECLSEAERRFIHQAERVLYAAMFVMPLSGFVHVMAGGYGVLLAGLWPLPNPIGRSETVSVLASWTHALAGIALAAAIAAHVGVVLRHSLGRGPAALLRRMLPAVPTEDAAAAPRSPPPPGA